MKLRKVEVQKDEVQERLSRKSKKVNLRKSKMQKGEVQEKVKCKKREVQEERSTRTVKCKVRLRKDREGGLSSKHALECLRHGADKQPAEQHPAGNLSAENQPKGPAN